jgi:hypothetical protein
VERGAQDRLGGRGSDPADAERPNPQDIVERPHAAGRFYLDA